MSRTAKENIKMKKFNKLVETDQSLLYFLVNMVKRDKVPELTRSKFPSELQQYKYLMHPIRITMLKILFQEYQISSVELKNLLDISWGDYTNHIKCLEEQGLVRTQEEFVGENLRQVVYLKELGREAYVNLKNLLVELLEDNNYIYDESEDDLYPID